MPHSVTLTPSLPALPMLVVAVSIVILGVVVLARERVSAVSLSFFGLTVSVSTWLVGVSLVYMAAGDGAALLFSRLAYVGVATIPAAVVHFTVALLDEIRRRRAVLIACWIASGVFVGLFAFTNLLLTGTWHYAWGAYPRLSVASGVFLVYFAALLGGSLALLMRKKSVTAQERRRNAAFLVALAVGYAGSVDYLAAFGINFYPIGFLFILGFIILAARAVLRFRLADLSPAFVAHQMLRTVHGGVIVVDMHGRIRVANAAAADLLGYSAGEIRGMDLCQLLGVSSLPATQNDSFVRRSSSRARAARWRRRDHSEVEVLLSATALLDEGRQKVGVLYAVSDLSDRRRAEQNEFSATHDLLTRLSNRAGFAESFAKLSRDVDETGRVAGVFFLDLDGFKAVNDVHGHATGDALLRIVASRLRNAVRGDDVIARHGGDEFVLLLNLARIADGEVVAGKLLRVIGEPFAIGDRQVKITASIGAAFYPRDGKAVDALIGIADGAMYGAKKAGKAQLRVATPRADVARADVAADPPFRFDARA